MNLFIRGAILLVTLSAVPASAQAKDFNDYVLKAITQLNSTYAKGGYDIGSAFTHDIPYADGAVKKSSPNVAPAPSMCVAGVTEIIITAINLYVAETRDRTAYTKIPLALWTRGNALSLRANLFMYAGTGSHGTAHSLKRFGMGQELGFDSLKAGDFINLNRTTHSGHAVVFLGYLDATGNGLPSAQGAKGFKYFSLQGKGKPDAGFGYRWAFFEGSCPTLAAGRTRDCHVIRSSNPVLLNAGRMAAPAEWNVEPAIRELREQGLRDIMGADSTISRGFADAELEKELPNSIDPSLNGVTEE